MLDSNKKIHMEYQLPKPRCQTANPISTTISKRRTHRDFSEQPANVEQLASLLWAAQGQSSCATFRNTPSPGGQYAAEIHVAIVKNDLLPAGTYRYDVQQHALEQTTHKAVSVELESAAIGDQSWVSTASIVVLIASDISSLNTHFEQQPPFGKRGERYAYIEAGTMVQNMALIGEEVGIGGVIVGGFDDEKVATIFQLKPHLNPLALYCAGRINQPISD